MVFNYSSTSTKQEICPCCKIILDTEDKTRLDQVKQCLKNRNQEGYPVYGYSGALNRHMKNDHNMTKEEIQEAKEKLKIEALI
tara:strand:- start:48 stop:296 length:249 start_codon:yes stop_codon:yes gene_type:complete